MKQIRLGRSELTVSRIAFGTWQLGGDWGSTDEAEAVAAIRRAADGGVTLFDTAQGYGFGASERLLSKALGTRREGLVIATKGGLRPTENGGVTRDANPAWIRYGVEASLRALGTETIDLYQLHWPDPATPFEETAETLVQLIEEGKVRHVGVSNFFAEQMSALSETLPVETLQPPYHLLHRSIEASILPYTRPTTSACWSTDHSHTGSSAAPCARTGTSPLATGARAAPTSAARPTAATWLPRPNWSGSHTTSSASASANSRSPGIRQPGGPRREPRHPRPGPRRPGSRRRRCDARPGDPRAHRRDHPQHPSHFRAIPGSDARALTHRIEAETIK
jgi:hypothetical protein